MKRPCMARKLRMPTSLLACAFALGAARAETHSIIGGAAARGGDTQHWGGGWPSLFYEWRRGGRPELGLGAELIYGDWSSAFSQVDLGLGVNVPMRFPLAHSGVWDLAFRLAPGAMVGSAEGRGGVIVGARAEQGLLVGAAMLPTANFVTGVNVPASVLSVENGSTYLVLPILGRFGMEILPTRPLSLWILGEMGPALAVHSDRVDVDPGVRAWVGGTFF